MVAFFRLSRESVPKSTEANAGNLKTCESGKALVKSSPRFPGLAGVAVLSALPKEYAVVGFSEDGVV